MSIVAISIKCNPKCTLFSLVSLSFNWFCIVKQWHGSFANRLEQHFEANFSKQTKKNHLTTPMLMQTITKIKAFVLVLDRFRICVYSGISFFSTSYFKMRFPSSYWQNQWLAYYIMQSGTQFSCNHLCSLFGVCQFIVRSSVKLRHKIVLQLWQTCRFLTR